MDFIQSFLAIGGAVIVGVVGTLLSVWGLWNRARASRERLAIENQKLRDDAAADKARKDRELERLAIENQKLRNDAEAEKAKKDDQRRQEREAWLNTQVQELFTDLRKRLQSVDDQLEATKEEHVKCRAENASLLARIAALEKAKVNP